VIVHSVFEPADNVALTGFEARAVPGDPTRYQAFAQIFNASSTAKHVRLQITSRSGFSLTRDFDVAPGRSVDRALDVSGFEQGVLRAQLQLDGDAFALDDVAFAVVTPHRAKRVLLVTPGNAFLEDSLHALTGVALTVERPAAYRTSQVFDAYVFDRFAPSDAPPGGALLFRPPPAPWLQLATKDVRKPTITAWDESHPVNAGVGWGDVRLLRALLAAPSPDTSVIVSAEGTGAGALLLAGRARAAWIEAGFALEDSNFAMQAGFPVFLGSALTWLSGAPSVLAEEIGHVEVPLSKAQVRDSQGNPIPTADTVDGTAFEAVRPDVYTASGAGRELTVVTNVRDPHYAQIDASWLSARGPDDPSRRRSPTLSWPEGWTALLVLAAVLLVIEWITFSRRITV